MGSASLLPAAGTLAASYSTLRQRPSVKRAFCRFAAVFPASIRYVCFVNAPPVFRPAALADLPAVAALANWAYRGEGGPVGWTAEGHLLGGPRTDVTSLTELLTRHAADRAVLLLAHDAATQQLIGCVFLHPQADALYLGLLTVAPDRQGTGLGQWLLQSGEHYASRHNCPVVRMTVLTARPELLAWYERRGYRRTGQELPFPADKTHGRPRQELTLQVLEKPVPPDLLVEGYDPPAPAAR